MMNNWFLCKIRYEKTTEKGMVRKVTESYLVEALSHTEAEARIIEEMESYISGDFTVSRITPAKFSDVFFCDLIPADRWFKCRLAFIVFDEKSGKKKKTFTNMLVQASDLRDAVNKLDEGMKASMADYIISSVSETDIWDVYSYKMDPGVEPEFVMG